MMNNITGNFTNNSSTKELSSNTYKKWFKFYCISSFILSLIIIYLPMINKFPEACLNICNKLNIFQKYKPVKDNENDKNKGKEKNKSEDNNINNNNNNNEIKDKEEKENSSLVLNIQDEKKEEEKDLVEKKNDVKEEKKNDEKCIIKKDDEKCIINKDDEKCIMNKDDEKCKIIISGDIMYGITFFGRLIMTYYSIYGLALIYNYFIQYIVLILGLVYDEDLPFDHFIFKYFIGFISIFFTLTTIPKILIIPTFEFFSFPFINYHDPLIHIMSFKAINKNEKFDTEKMDKKYNYIVNGLLIFVEICYFFTSIISLLSNITTFKDYTTFGILSIVYIYYLVIFFCYILTYANILFINNFENREKLPDINLISYIINPKLNICYKSDGKDLDQIKDYWYIIVDKTKIIVIILKIFYAFYIIYTSCKKQKKDISIIILMLFSSFIIILSSYIMIFPFCFKSKRIFENFCNSDIEFKEKYKPKYPKMLSIIRFFCFLICFLISIILSYIYCFLEDKNDDNFTDFNLFKKIKKSNFDLDETENKNIILPSICYSSIYDIPITLFVPFINDAYYYNGKKSSLDFKEYKELFFDEKYKIKTIGNLIKDETIKKKVKMIQYNIIKNNVNVTILSIKGTSYKRDMYLDFQLYIPSVLLNLLTTFSIVTKLKDTHCFHLVEYSLSIPYRLYFKYLIIDDYIKTLNKTYIENDNNHKFSENVIIVGHSLGGGLSKILGKLVKKQSISLSGPGVNAFHSLWGKEGISDNFDISTIDLVPDMDLVPRVEVSGGTIYRIICREGAFNCHNKAYSLCELLIMCRFPNRKIYCRTMANFRDSQIEKIEENSELN